MTFESISFYNGFCGRSPLFVSFAFSSGLRSVDDSSKPCLFDSPSQRYGPGRDAARAFTIFQIGICVFVPNSNDKDNEKIYNAKPFTFNVIPAINSKSVGFLQSCRVLFHHLSRYWFVFVCL